MNLSETKMVSRAIHEIQCEANTVTTVLISEAIEACNWRTLHVLAERLQELAQRGLYHSAQERQKEISQFALNGYRPDAEAR